MSQPMSQEQLSLLRAVIENPDNNDVRLVYADYLEEVSNLASERARAEFIRLQINEGDRSDKVFDIWSKYYKLWRTNLWPLTLTTDETENSSNSIHTVYTRGFISSIRLNHNIFLMKKLAGILFTFEPIIKVKLLCRTPDFYEGTRGWRSSCRIIDNRIKHTIDPRLFKFLPEENARNYNLWRIFDDEKEAYKALSNACVSYGREEAEKYLNERVKINNR